MRPRLALLILALALCIPALAAAQPERIDVPPVFRLDFPPGTDVTVRVVWAEESNATDRWLMTERRGQIAYYGEEIQVAVYVDYFDFDDWRPGETLTLCRRWVVDPIFGRGDVVSCHTRTPWPLYSVFLPGL